MQYLLGFAITGVSGFLIFLVMIQRGRGGGLTGALGGSGGQSAFGSKAGDTFTRITTGVAAFWIVLCAERRSGCDLGGGDAEGRQANGRFCSNARNVLTYTS